jgi:hypothetical protein
MEPSDEIVVIDDIESVLFLLVSSRSSLNVEKFFCRKSNLLIFSPPKLVRLSLTMFFDAENNRSITVSDAGIAKTCFGVFRSWNRTPREIFLGVRGGVGGEHPFFKESVPVPELEKEKFWDRSRFSEAKKSPPLGSILEGYR